MPVTSDHNKSPSREFQRSYPSTQAVVTSRKWGKGGEQLKSGDDDEMRDELVVNCGTDGTGSGVDEGEDGEWVGTPPEQLNQNQIKRAQPVPQFETRLPIIDWLSTVLCSGPACSR